MYWAECGERLVDRKVQLPAGSLRVRTGTANLPLHYGKAPRWLFERMRKLAREIAIVIVTEFGTKEMLARLADPFWFQCLGCVLGFDWHSSGVTTTTCGALKDGLRGVERELGLYVTGGKGAVSRRTPDEIRAWADLSGVDADPLVYASRLSAKVDSSALQDGYQVYHHVLIFDAQGQWAVVQQGMNESTRYARRYHWLGEQVHDFVCEPHVGICSEQRGDALNMVAGESESARSASTELAGLGPENLVSELERLKTMRLPSRHEVLLSDIHPKRLLKIFNSTHSRQPESFETLLGMRGVGPKAIRALSLLSELVYGAPLSFRDPARFSFAHGGKDGFPYPVDRPNYDRSIQAMRRAIEKARLGRREEIETFRRLSLWETNLET